jgi:hypothetical protein
MTSWIESTIPPGYRVIEDWDAVEESWAWFSYTENRETCKYGFRTRSECCRAAWRHWTASILRGRDVLWRHPDSREHYDFDPCVRASGAVIRWLVEDNKYFVGSFFDDLGKRVPLFSDIDEAMVRFVSYLMYYQGPSQKINQTSV